jgi:hypothetical protein
MKTLIIFILISMAQKSIASVWTANRDWNIEDEIKYSEWVKANLKVDIFSNKESLYFGIKTDCADAAMALRTIYAFEQKLPISFKDNDGKFISNDSTSYDYLKSDLEKLKEMIRDIGENIGSETLADDNSYPIALAEIKPGDIYITKWKNSTGIDTRHVYFIKDILPTGDLLLYSSTQPRAVRPLLARKGMPLHIIDGKPYGFKRFKMGVHFQTPSLDYSQYNDLEKGEVFYFSKVKSTHQMIKDTLSNNISERIENICVALQTRQDVILSTIEYKNQIQNRCLTKEEYTEYSTPSRDFNITNDIEKLMYGWRVIKQRGIQDQIPSETQLALDYLINKNNNPEALNALNTFCKVQFTKSNNQEITMSIRSYYERYRFGVISSNPNEIIDARWGFAKEVKDCPTY